MTQGRPALLALLIGLAGGCSPDPGRLLVMDGEAGEYRLVETRIPELTDPRHMRGSLGDGRVGGYLGGKLDLSGGTVEDLGYKGGGPIEVDWVLDDGVAVPLDADGIALWSYYNTLSEVGPQLEAVGYDASGVFPVPFAFQPSLGGITLASTNAAYVAYGAHLFVLLPDPRAFRLPLAANPGVIRHEFGHAVFQDIVGGGPYEAAEHTGNPAAGALNEGFADILATLMLDDPDFFAASLDSAALNRDVRDDHNTRDAAPVDTDPYSRGSVYAALAWDLRMQTDPDFALSAALEALRRWADDRAWEDDVAGADRFARLLVEVALERDAALATSMCAAHTSRFDDVGSPAACR